MTESQLRLQVIICSTRPGRKGPAVAEWAAAQARAHGKFAVELVDLADFNLPILDEVAHPRLGQYEHEHTKRWSASVARADAFVLVLPEYDFSMPASLLNALQCIYKEWTYKPAGLVSYGGESGGLRSAQMTRQALATFKVVPMLEAVSIHQIAKHVDATTGVFQPEDGYAKKATAMLDELHRWAEALKTLRP
ncbi:MAG: NAD(P)H-dependent oxidoreductase [Gemmatimonadetes bacterium]|nr:NAD(P)H-dependent oxidoreductase [Gemmatimonadota bacterium]